MKYVANPVEVNAYKILEVQGASSMPGRGITYNLTIGDADGQSENQRVVATPEMTSRMEPRIGDYWVIQSDGYAYLNPKDVFERKYRALGKRPTIDELQKILDSEGDTDIVINGDGSISAKPGEPTWKFGTFC